MVNSLTKTIFKIIASFCIIYGVPTAAIKLADNHKPFLTYTLSEKFNHVRNKIIPEKKEVTYENQAHEFLEDLLEHHGIKEKVKENIKHLTMEGSRQKRILERILSEATRFEDYFKMADDFLFVYKV